MRVLVVDDNVAMRDLMTNTLSREGYEVLAASDGRQALSRWQTEQPDLVLLEGNLPKVDGFEVCRRIRQGSRTPVIMVTARDREEDILRGLHLGADDYMTKPFSARQLAARMRTVLRRSNRGSLPNAARMLEVGQLAVDPESHQVLHNDVPVQQLTRLEFRILSVLALNEGQIIPYAQLIAYAFGYANEDGSRLLRTHICRIRKKLGLGPSGGGGIKAVLGVGYSLTVHQQRSPSNASSCGSGGRSVGPPSGQPYVGARGCNVAEGSLRGDEGRLDLQSIDRPEGRKRVHRDGLGCSWWTAAHDHGWESLVADVAGSGSRGGPPAPLHQTVDPPLRVAAIASEDLAPISDTEANCGSCPRTARTGKYG